MISVVVPVKNGGPGLVRCLEAIRAQDVDEEVEVIVVDSGSTDGTQEAARSLGARVHEIAPEDFNHGETRNLGASLASGDVVVFTVDDALPVGSDWLFRLTEPFRHRPGLAGTFGRHLANETAPPHQAFYIDSRYGPQPRTIGPETASASGVHATFSNVASAIRRDVLADHPFAPDIVIAEDAEWCVRVVDAGYAIEYVPHAVVRHSHTYSLADTIKRYFDLGASSGRSKVGQGSSRRSGVTGSGARYVGEELLWMWRGGHRRAIPAAVAHEGARFVGYKLGVHHRFVPRRFRSRLSRTAIYWS